MFCHPDMQGRSRLRQRRVSPSQEEILRFAQNDKLADFDGTLQFAGCPVADSAEKGYNGPSSGDKRMV